LRRAVGASVVLAACALLLGNGALGTTLALFNGETTNNDSAFAGGWIGAATVQTPTPSGDDLKLNWTAGTHGPVTGQQVWGVNNTTSNNCTGAAYASLSGALTATATTYTHTNAGSTANGNWYCYEVISTSATAWTATTAFAP